MAGKGRGILIAGAVAVGVGTLAYALPSDFFDELPAAGRFNQILHHESTRTFATAADAKGEGGTTFTLPAFTPSDATDVKVKTRRGGPDGALYRFRLGRAALAPAGTDCPAAARPAAPLAARWFPGDAVADARTYCDAHGTYQVVVRGDTVYAWRTSAS
ncbi:hypothetical protein ABT160_05820 [Streptomyces sp. NPDC001941]|uniref:hypothetical protein n=1 Tax=Streptomyces sp. NPDC001941 TaxID=3154659 RepID=UPI00331ED7AB